MQHGGNNSGIYPHHNIYGQCDGPLNAIKHELNHVISAMPDNDSHKRNEQEKHQVIASSNNLLHVREEFDLPVQSQTSQTHESKLSKQISMTLKNEKQKRKQCTKKELEHDKRHHITKKIHHSSNLILNIFVYLFGDNKKTSLGKKKHTRGQAFKLFSIYLNSHHEEGKLNLSGRNLQQRWRTYKRKFVQTAQFLKGTGQGLDVMTNNTLQEDVNSFCPCFNQMVAIFGKKQNVIGHNVFESTTKINKELDADKHIINSYESDTDSQGISVTENLSEKDVSIEPSSQIVISFEDSQLEGSDHITTSHKEESNHQESSIKITSSKIHKRKHFGSQTQIPPKLLP
ncbi:hypothetical protein O181_116968 [Austropuccinia psidii MF-1]|uniref:Uncharacterized protein n=1 Tax=Austropuccinia psidii MF-1 TaxID=1389203 RepID=A0A9Q3K9E7_9BASI|nr:hypothetical protein [Austropuccinia psidii MF-1]